MEAYLWFMKHFSMTNQLTQEILYISKVPKDNGINP